MRRSVTLVASLALSLALLAGCGGDDEAAGENDPIVIGAVAGFTGFMAPFDVPPYNAARLAAQHINRDGGVLGRRLKIIAADMKSDKVEAGRAANRLLDQGAVFLTAPCDFDFGAAAAIEGQKREVPTMSTCAGTVQFGVQAIGPYAYTMGNSAAGYLSATAEWAYEEMGWRRAYVLQDDSIEFHKQGCRAFVAKWESLSGASVVRYDHFQQDDPSIDAQITRIKSQSPAPDFIVECSHPPGAITALRQIRASGIDMPIVGEGQSFDGEFWKESVPGLSDFYFASNASTSGDDPREEVNELLREMNEKFEEEVVTSTFLTGYSAIQAFAVAAENAGTVEGPALNDALQSLENEELIIGPTTFTPELHMSLKRRVAILEIQDGETRFVTFRAPKSVPPLEEWVSG